MKISRRCFSRLIISLGLFSGTLATAHANFPANDNFEDATVISGTDGSVGGTNVSGSLQTGEPQHANASVGASVWWRWTAPLSGPATIDTFGSDFDTVMAVYTGSWGNLHEVASNDDSGGTTSRVNFTATDGIVYYIAVAGYSGDIGDVVLNWTMSPANDDFAGAVDLFGRDGSINGTNAAGTIEDGEPAHAGVSASASVWWRWTAPASGPVTINTFGSDFDTVLAVYTGSWGSLNEVASNDDSGGTTSRVDFSATEGVIYHIAVDGFNANGANIALNWTMDHGFPADDFADATVLSGLGGAYSGNNFGATMQEGEPVHAGVASVDASVWWRWTAPASGLATFHPWGSDFGPVLAVYTGSWGSLNEVAGAAEWISEISFEVTAFTVYHIAVAGGDGHRGRIALNWGLDASIASYSEWAEAISDASLRQASASASGDHVANAIRYALGVGPHDFVADRLPSLSLDSSGGMVLELVYGSAVSGTTLEVQVSSDLATWTVVATSENGSPFNSAMMNITEVSVDDNTRKLILTEAPTGAPAKFARLTVTVEE